MTLEVMSPGTYATPFTWTYFQKTAIYQFYETFLEIIFPESGGMVHNVVAFIIEKQAAGEILVCDSPLAVVW